ncbi:MAG: AmmeMemoRadiSam system radical SAM enzyme [Anaerolineae bacterium]|nr:AmmeMemoRadiSam system radical SAM enzyme [Anaerolineae bacterium]
MLKSTAPFPNGAPFRNSALSRSLRDKAVQCRTCEHYCTLAPGDWGKCGVRVNRDGQLVLTVYGQAIAAHVDPIEKKPLFHFLPGSSALSIGTYGCNMRCRWCQNADISQVRQVEGERFSAGQLLMPEQLVEIAHTQGCASIAYTYNEPTVFFEYTYDTAKLASEQGIKNVYVSNGFMSTETLETIAPYLDGINVDLKGFTDDLYRTYCDARLDPIKRNIAYIAQKTGIWIEVTTLIVPGLNDSDAELSALAAWLAEVDPAMPWHVSAFHPSYKMQDRGRTPAATLERAYQIGKDAGLQFVYVGNLPDTQRESTYCPACGELLIRRYGFHTQPVWKTPGICPTCGVSLAGVWS